MTVSDKNMSPRYRRPQRKGRHSADCLFPMNSLKLLAQRNKININGAKCGGALWSHCKDEYCGVLQSTP